MTANTELILVNLGTPAAPTADAVRAFLREFLSDPQVVDYPRWLWQPILRGIVLRRRPVRVAEMYRSIWTDQGSPLADGSLRIRDRLAEQLDGVVRVRLAYRYGTPSLTDALHESRAEHCLVLPLFPQRTASSSGTIVDLVNTWPVDGATRPRCIELAADDERYVEALSDRYQQAVADGPEPDHLLVSFHGIPVRHDRREGGRYVADCQATTDALRGRLGLEPDRVTLAYQSKFGPDRWLTPATAALLEELPRRGVRHLAVITPGFLTEGLETLEEIGIRGRDTFLAAGGERLLRVPAVEHHPALIEALSDCVKRSLTVF